MFWNGPEALGHKGAIVGLVRLLTEGGYRMSMAQPPPGFSSFDRDRFIRDVSSEQWMGGDADELGVRFDETVREAGGFVRRLRRPESSGIRAGRRVASSTGSSTTVWDIPIDLIQG